MTARIKRRRTIVLLPFQAGSGEIRAAGLPINPGLEEVPLARDAGRWHPCLDATFASAAGSRPLARNAHPDAATGVTGHLSQTSLSARIAGREDTYRAEAGPGIRAASSHAAPGLLIRVLRRVAKAGHLGIYGRIAGQLP